MLCEEVEGRVFPAGGEREKGEGREGLEGEKGLEDFVVGKGEEREGGKTKQERGMRRAREREMVRQAGRRIVVFGVPGEASEDAGGRERADGDGERLAVEAVQEGRVVEASFAKGEWGVRWKT